MTSRQAVDLVGRVLPRRTKLGHAGTLDPLASGVLVLCAGAATRLIQYVQQMPKLYVATFLLGRHSASEDVDTEVIELDNPPIPTREQLVAAASQFVGQIHQRPPAYSALKVAGRRAYDLARAGKTVELAPRPVTVHRLEISDYTYPEARMEVHCGSGTYVRSLGRDLAESLGTAAVMSGLQRTAVGAFAIDRSVAPSKLTTANLVDHLLPPRTAVEHLPGIELSPEQLVEVGHGRMITMDVSRPPAAEYAAVNRQGQLIAILAPGRKGWLRPVRNLPPA